MTQKPKEEQEEEEEEEGLWQRIVRSVRENPLRYKPEQELRQEIKAKIKAKVKAEEEEATERNFRVDASPFVAEAEKQPQEEASRGKGLDKRTARRLRRGEMAIDARLDLHGLRRGAGAGIFV